MLNTPMRTNRTSTKKTRRFSLLTWVNEMQEWLANTEQKSGTVGMGSKLINAKLDELPDVSDRVFGVISRVQYCN